VADLATPADVVARLGRALTTTEAERLPALLADASAKVRAYTRQQLEAGSSTVALWPERGKVRLPQRPVTDVTAVTDTEGEDVSFTWYEGDQLVLSSSAGTSIRLDLDAVAIVRPVTVAYEHGYASIPDDIVAVVCGVVLRALGRTPLDSGVQQQSIAGYSETFGAVGAAGPVGLLNEEKEILDAYRRRSGRVLAGGW
jgi:hypothetical protein